MLNLLLYSDGSVSGSLVAIFIMFVVIMVIVFIVQTAGDAKEAHKKGGIKGYYSDLIKFIMQNYPNTEVIKDNVFYMEILSDDMKNDVKMKFTLRLFVPAKNLKVTGEILPGTKKWAWIPNKSFQWEESEGSDFQQKQLIKKIKEAMIFNPE